MKNLPALLLIPDISGFTKFVNQTAQEHSRHIISELLEIIIKAGKPELEIAEIEGDAVFFYKLDATNIFEFVINKAKKIFIDFHQHLLLYENRRVCNCGACSTAVNLNVKIIAHFGNIGFIEVGKKKKPFGKNIILIHKLLKNSINSEGYLLLTNAFENYECKEEEWFRPEKGNTFYKDIGNIPYIYSSLNILKRNLSPITSLNNLKKINKPIVVSSSLPCKYDEVFESIANLDRRAKWQKSVDALKYDRKAMNRVGSSHICVIGNNEIEIETLSKESDKNKIVFGEKTKYIPLVREMSTYYIIESQSENQSKIYIEVHYVPHPIIGKLIFPIFRKIMKKNLDTLLIDIDNYCRKSSRDDIDIIS
ncbi:MAG: DUF2652 domain-containing protein [Bacteroidota bacterium]